MKGKLLLASMLTVLVSTMSGYAVSKNEPRTFRSTQEELNKKYSKETNTNQASSSSNQANASQNTSQPKVAIYTMNRCPYCDKVSDYLSKINKSIPFKNVSTNRAYHDELMKYGGKPQVPCLVVDGKAIYESDAIIQWIANNKNKLN